MIKNIIPQYKSFLGLLCLLLVVGCFKKPTEPSSDNPLDLKNPSTSGDPFELNIAIANGGITLTWTAINLPNLKEYNIYRSLSENDGYTIIESVSKTATSFVDTTIVNGHSYWYLITGVDNKNNETSRTNVSALNVRTGAVLVINGGAEYTASRAVSITILAQSATEMIISNNSDFTGSSWESYATLKPWTLPLGEGLKTVYLKVKYEDDQESVVISSTISPQEITNMSFSISDGDTSNTLDVELNISAEAATEMIISNDSSFSDVFWEDYSEEKSWHLALGSLENPITKVFIKYRNDFEMESTELSDEIFLLISAGIQINNNAEFTSSRSVTLSLFSDNADEMILSENGDFSGAVWENYVDSKLWVLPTGQGPFTIYAKFKNSSGLVSNDYSDIIEAQPINPNISISSGAEYTSTRNIPLILSASGSNLQMKLSEDSTFTGLNWQSFSANPNFQLSMGEGTKRVYAKFINDFQIESSLVSDEILPQPINPAILIASGAEYTSTRDIALTLSATGSNLQMKMSEDSTFTGVDWKNYTANLDFQISTGDGIKTVYAKFINDFQVQVNQNDQIILDTTPPVISISFSPDSGITNETNFQFDVTGSTDNQTAMNNLEARFDWRNDGTFDTGWSQPVITNHQYSTGGGDVAVNLELRDLAGWISDTSITMFVNTRPQASFNVTVDESDVKLYHFDASASSDYEDGTNLLYRWDWDGDGIFDTGFITSSIIDYEYQLTNNYNPVLEVLDQNGLINNINRSITVHPSVQYSKSLPMNWGEFIQQTSDNGYIIFCTTSNGLGLIKTNSNGDVEWQNTYQGHSPSEVHQTEEGGYIFAGSVSPGGEGNTDIWLVKTDASGIVMWDTTFGGNDTDLPHSIQQTDDGGYIIAGETNSYGAGEQDCWMIKTDESGSLEWDKTYGGSSLDKAISVKQTSDGGYVLAGETYSFGAGHYDFWLIKADATGNLQWDQTYGWTSEERAYSVQLTNDGGFILAGGTNHSNNGGYDYWIVKTDALGTQLWQNIYGGINAAEWAFSVRQTHDNGYVFGGILRFFKVNESGDYEWDIQIANDLEEIYGRRIIQAIDGGYIILGTQNFIGASQPILIKLN